MKKSDLKFMPQFFDRYIDLVPGEETVLEALENSKTDLLEIKGLLEKYKDYKYQEGKWNPKQMLQHIIDTERILSYRALVYSRNDSTILSNFDNNKFPIYNWSIKPINFDVNVYDTLYVDGSIKLGTDDPIEINTDMLRYIKSIPFHFDNDICLVDKDPVSESYYKKVCITKDKIEMLNGSRQINLQSIVPSKPFILYSGPNFTGRELRIGFSYQRLNDLPYIGDINEWLNPSDNGKWLSLKIDGPYSVIIFSKVLNSYKIMWSSINFYETCFYLILILSWLI